MIEVRETPEFTRWLAALKDQRAVFTSFAGSAAWLLETP